ncbi:hypothetical protein I4U23_022065, partial [Adineta vaga]
MNVKHQVVKKSLDDLVMKTIPVAGTGNEGSESNQLSSPVTSSKQLQFCPTAAWNRNAITIANQSIVGRYPGAIFINAYNTIFVANQEAKQILIWNENSTIPTKTLSGNFQNPGSIFVTQNGDIYIDDGLKNGRVQRWIASNNTFVTVLKVYSACHGLFIDLDNNLYCSINIMHQ